MTAAATDTALAERALRVREHVIRMAGGGGCFIGASLSCADLLVHLYERVLRLSPATLTDPARDYLLLSKGHDVPALYGTLAELGYLPAERLGRHLDPTDNLYWHPNRSVPGVEFHSGSLGHLLAVAAGVAVDVQLGGGKNRVFVVLGDGELDEGSVWEAAMCAGKHRLSHLTAIIDYNKIQSAGSVFEIQNMEPLADKWTAFGFRVFECNGHDVEDLRQVFRDAAAYAGDRPRAVICHTVKGKGIPAAENNPDWHHKSDLKPAELQIVRSALGN